MPSCPPSCPKVKQQLKRRAAEKKKALEAGLGPPDTDGGEKAPEDRTSVKEPFPVDFDSELDHDSQGRISKGSSSARSKKSAGNGAVKSNEDITSRIEDDVNHQETSSRRAYSSGSQGRSLKNSSHNLSVRSSKVRSANGEKQIRDGNLRSDGSDFGESDGDSRSPGRGRRDHERNGDAKSGPSTSSASVKKSHRKSGKTRRDGNTGYETDLSEEDDPGEYFSDQGFDPSKHNPCSSECSLKKLKEEMMRKKLEAKQKAVDDYLLNTGMHYFEDLCYCSSMCLAKQLWYDPFVRKMIVSAALFAVGIKLCWEMDAWYIPTPSIT